MSDKQTIQVTPESVDPDFCIHWCLAVECETPCLRCGHACNEHSFGQEEGEPPFCIGDSQIDCDCQGVIEDFPEEDAE